MGGIVCVADIQRDILFSYRHYASRVEHLCAQKTQLAKLRICYELYRFGIRNYRRVCHQNTGHVSPVFIYIGFQGCGGQGSRDIASAAGQSFDLASRHDPEKARSYDPLAFCSSIE